MKTRVAAVAAAILLGVIAPASSALAIGTIAPLERKVPVTIFDPEVTGSLGVHDEVHPLPDEFGRGGQCQSAALPGETVWPDFGRYALPTLTARSNRAGGQV
jgi:hypothetical protein